jgi:hypothetical protein
MPPPAPPHRQRVRDRAAMKPEQGGREHAATPTSATSTADPPPRHCHQRPNASACCAASVRNREASRCWNHRFRAISGSGTNSHSSRNTCPWARSSARSAPIPAFARNRRPARHGLLAPPAPTHPCREYSSEPGKKKCVMGRDQWLHPCSLFPSAPYHKRCTNPGWEPQCPRSRIAQSGDKRHQPAHR